ncbi:hypothetical protein GE061_006214 [Apolygus lucorum]|uniref:Uncharacterized protein n=1 Tax=Apolygus lucorum TaxID=248454 RepID=A0A6A4J900_APOLU|nr:hypothetical protein GE061_006214 [Apolygus lucorum]
MSRILVTLFLCAVVLCVAVEAVQVRSTAHHKLKSFAEALHADLKDMVSIGKDAASRLTPLVLRSLNNAAQLMR